MWDHLTLGQFSRGAGCARCCYNVNSLSFSASVSHGQYTRQAIIYLSIHLFISAGNSRYFRNPHKAKIITQTLFMLTSEFPAFPRLLIIVGLTKVHTGNHIK